MLSPYDHLMIEFGSAAEVSRTLGIARSTVNKWKNGIPNKYIRSIELATDHKLTRKILKP
jgi:DNA-binding transcriptional regulator YdaS (Cro superfamily)